MGWAVSGNTKFIEAISYITRTQSWCSATPLQVAMGKIINTATNQPYSVESWFFVFVFRFFLCMRV